jgi:hypothetical protein
MEDWDQFVCGVQFAYNSSVHASTGFTPFSLVTGRAPSFPEDGWLRAAHKPQSRPEYLQNLHRVIARTHVECSEALFKSWSDLKRRFDAKRRDISLPVDFTVLVRLSDYERSDPAVVRRVLSCGKVYEILRTGKSRISMSLDFCPCPRRFGPAAFSRTLQGKQRCLVR